MFIIEYIDTAEEIAEEIELLRNDPYWQDEHPDETPEEYVDQYYPSYFCAGGLMGSSAPALERDIHRFRSRWTAEVYAIWAKWRMGLKGSHFVHDLDAPLSPPIRLTDRGEFVVGLLVGLGTLFLAALAGGIESGAFDK